MKAHKDLSQHAAERAGQRAIRRAAVEATLTWGTEIRQPNGRTALFLDEAAVARARVDGHDVSKWQNTALVQADDGEFVTTLKSDDARRLRQHGRRRRPNRRFGG